MRMTVPGGRRGSMALLLLLCLTSEHVVRRVSGQGSGEEAPLLSSPTYTVLAPSKLRPNSDYHVSVSLHNVPNHVDVDVTISGTETGTGKLNQVSKTILLTSEETRILNFEVGEWGPGAYKILVVGRGGGEAGIDFRNVSAIRYDPKSYSCFIQTDKAIYKPGQLVQFRAIIVNPSLIPSVTGAIDIHVKDAKGNRIKQWSRELTSRGVISKELQLSDQPVLGDWTIVVNVLQQKFEKTFTVAEYLLPTFDVDVLLPSYATYNESDVTCTIKATYTYGKPVKGEVTLTVQPRVRYNMLTVRPLEQFQVTTDVDGSVDIPVNVVRNLNLKTDFFEREIEFFALVQESLTGRKYNKTGILKMFDKKIKVDLVKTSKTFKPGLTYAILLKVSYQDDTPVPDNGPVVRIRYGYSYNDDSWSSVLTGVPVKGLLSFDLQPPKSDVMVLGLKAEYLGQEYYLETVDAAQSPSNNFLQLTMVPGQPDPRVGSDVSFSVIATEPFDKVVYEVMGRGDIVLARSFSLAPTDRHDFSFPVTHAMAPKARIVAYYVRKQNQEVVADAVNFDVDGVFRTPVSLRTSVNETKPGASVQVSVATKVGAFVALLGLDQSILLLKTGNDVSRTDVMRELETYDGGKSSADPFQPWNSRRRRRRSLWWPGSVSAGEIFEDSGVILLSNGLVHRNFPAIYYRNSPVMYAAMPMAGAAPNFDDEDGSDLRSNKLHPNARSSANKVRVRKYFPETWFWSDAIAGADGTARFAAAAPDTITSWVLTAFAMDSVTGLGITAGPSKVTVFRPFFLQLALPYSVIRGESIAITVVLFNYQNKEQNAEVTLDNRKGEFDFTVAGDMDHYNNDVEVVRLDEKKKYVTIGPQDGVTVTFLITPRKLGNIDIKVTAVSPTAGDSVLKQLLVRPEGQPQYFNKGILVDLRDKANAVVKKNISFEVPRNAIPGSERITVSVIGDILGPGIDNVDDLLKMPYGCGEQNMLNFVPNIVILDYLKRANRLTPAIRTKALAHMETGYQRELTYKRSDGSFSAFGNNDKAGSTWLTAFVLKSFLQARDHMDIDPKVISEMYQWLMARQLTDGSFDEPGEVHNKAMQGGSGSKGSPALSAFVLTAVLQDRSIARNNFTSQVQQAEQYLVRKLRESRSTYEVAIITYALQLYESPAAESAHQKLVRLASRSGDHVFWPTSRDKVNTTEKQSFHFFLPKSNDVEATAYALLTNVLRREVEESIPILRWLVSQQGESGGFSTTQDTVVGIQALAALATQVASNNIQLGCLFRYGADGEAIKSRRLDIIPDNQMVVQRLDLAPSTRWVEVEASGFGTAILQVSWQFNLAVSAEEPAFFLNPQIGKTSNENFLQLNICTYYKAGNSTNMAVMEVALPSGYTADVDALPAVTRAREVKRIDTSDGDTNVIIYMDRITRDELCVTVPAHRNYRVANHKPVPVTVYDYYNRVQTARMFYEPKLAPTCKICDGDECGSSCNSVEHDGHGGSVASGGKGDNQFGRQKSAAHRPAVSSLSSLLLIANLVTLLASSAACCRR